jgi:WD40 repeat protein
MLTSAYRILSGTPWKCVNEVRAHGGEVTDIAVESGRNSCLVASAGRDRMVQLFQRYEEDFQLIQTMDDHVGAVTQLLFINDGEKLLSSSADRTILVRDRVTRDVDGVTAIAYILTKVITLKSSPISMTLSPDSQDTLIVSTMDRCVQKLDIASGRHIHSFRAADPDANDSVVMGSLTVAAEVPGQSPRLLIGVSGTDKSIRVYDFERDLLLTGEFGHAEGVSHVLLLENGPDDSERPPKRTLVSAGMDGIVMIWNLSVQPPQPQDLAQQNTREEEETPVKELTASKPPLRRILSRSELAGFQRQDSLPATPTPVHEQSPLVRKKLSRCSLAPPLRNGNVVTPSPPSASTRPSPASCISAERTRRSPSPVSPKSAPPKKPGSASNNDNRGSSLDFRARGKNNGRTEFGSLGMSTEQVCRTLRAYRKKLNGSPERLHGADLQRELNLTLRVVNSRNKNSGSPETETDSSGKENRTSPSTPHIRKAPSTPSLGQKASRQVSRSRSLDADGEG